MQYCPKCREEFEDGTDVCPDCQVDLISEIPPEIPEEYKDAEWVELYSFPGGLYAQMAVEMLAREDIPAYSQTIFSPGSPYALGPGDAVGACGAVFVLEHDAPRALKVIEPMIDEIPRNLENGDDDFVSDDELE